MQENLSFNEAVNAGILNVREERIDGTNLHTAASLGLIDQTLQQVILVSLALLLSVIFQLLTSPIGIRDGGELTLIQAVSQGYIDPGLLDNLNRRF